MYRLEAVFSMRLFSSRNHRAHSCCFYEGTSAVLSMKYIIAES